MTNGSQGRVRAVYLHSIALSPAVATAELTNPSKAALSFLIYQDIPLGSMQS